MVFQAVKIAVNPASAGFHTMVKVIVASFSVAADAFHPPVPRVEISALSVLKFTFKSLTLVISVDDASGVAYDLIADYDVSMDGRRFVFPKYNPTPESGPKARVVLNWFATLRRLASAGK